MCILCSKQFWIHRVKRLSVAVVHGLLVFGNYLNLIEIDEEKEPLVKLFIRWFNLQVATQISCLQKTTFTLKNVFKKSNHFSTYNVLLDLCLTL